MNPFQSLRDYEEFVYTLPQQFTAIVSCTLPQLSYARPNLPALIEEIQSLAHAA